LKAAGAEAWKDVKAAGSHMVGDVEAAANYLTSEDLGLTVTCDAECKKSLLTA